MKRKVDTKENGNLVSKRIRLDVGVTKLTSKNVNTTNKPVTKTKIPEKKPIKKIKTQKEIIEDLKVQSVDYLERISQLSKEKENLSFYKEKYHETELKLEKSIEENEEYRKLVNKINEEVEDLKKVRLNLEKAEKELSNFREDLDSTNKKATFFEVHYQKNEEEIKNYKELYNNCSKDLFNEKLEKRELEKNLQQIEKNKNNEIEKIVNEYEILIQKINLNSEKSSMESKREFEETIRNLTEKKLNEFNDMKSSKENEYKDIKNNYETLLNKIKFLEDESIKIKAELKEKEQIIQNKESFIVELKRIEDNLKEDIYNTKTMTEEQIRNLKSEYESKFEKERNLKYQEIQEIKTENQKLMNESTFKIEKGLFQINSYEEEIKILKEEVKNKENSIIELEKKRSTLEENNEKIKMKFENFKIRKEEELKSFKEEKEKYVDDLKKEYETNVEMLKTENKNDMKRLLDNKNEEISEIKINMSSSAQDIQKKFVVLLEKFNNTNYDATQYKKSNDEKDVMIENLNDKIMVLMKKNQTNEQIRRKLHNQILELKGNIRVFCRVRPVLKSDKVEENYEHFTFNDKSDFESTISLKGPNKVESKFKFDQVFKPDDGQEKIFEEISQLVQSALDGYKVCIFAYGQTGSGKTHTMEGEISSKEHRGMIPRSVDQIFQTAQKYEKEGWNFLIKASFLEIYNNKINDLLSEDSDFKKYEIKHNGSETYVTNLDYIEVKTPSDVYVLLNRANKNRSVGSTAKNERSSRSHSVFQLIIKATNSINNESIEGQLNLIDLAGSERINESKVTGDRQKEAIAINKSLSELKNVIKSIAKKEKHIPFRNCELTYLLQNCLGGDSKTLMFVNISPLSESINECVHSLNFACEVNNCEIGQAKKKTVSKKN
jgi:kinesin family member C1